MEAFTGQFIDGVGCLWMWIHIVISIWLWLFPHSRILSSYYLCLAFVYTMKKIIQSMHTIGTTGEGIKVAVETCLSFIPTYFLHNLDERLNYH